MTTDEGQGKSNRSRFTDNPFRDPNISPEQAKKLDERNRAIQVFYETGDRGPAEAVGLFPKSEKKDDKLTDTTRTVEEARIALGKINKK